MRVGTAASDAGNREAAPGISMRTRDTRGRHLQIGDLLARDGMLKVAISDFCRRELQYDDRHERTS